VGTKHVTHKSDNTGLYYHVLTQFVEKTVTVYFSLAYPVV